MAEPNGLTIQEGKPQYQFNGLNSNNSSRGASPVPRVGLIPASQLPPNRSNIPASQLPPSRSAYSGVTQKIGQLSVSGQNTPNISPNKFSTSTPNQEEVKKTVFSENASPVVPKSLENVPLTDNASSDIINKNISMNQGPVNSFNPNTVPYQNTKTLPFNQLPENSTSQYFKQGSSFNTHLNGPPSQTAGRQNLVQNQIPLQPQGNGQKTQTANVFSTNQVSQNSNNLGRQTPQNYFQQSNFSNVYTSSLPGSQPLQNVGRTASQNPFIQQTQPSLVEPGHSFIHQSPGLNQPQTSRPLSQPQLSTVSSQNQNFQRLNQDNVLQGNSAVAKQPPPYSSYPPQVSVGQAQNAPPSSGALSSQAPPLNTVSQPPLQTIPSGQPQRPRYPPVPQTQNVAQGVPPRPQFNTGLPQRTSPHPSGNINQLNAPLTQSHPMAPLPSQRFNPQINYNAGPPTNTGPFPPQPFNQPSNQPSYGAPTSLNGPSTLPPLNQNQNRSGISSNRYPSSPQQQPGLQTPSYPNQGGVLQSGFNKLWGAENYDLLQLPNILPPSKIKSPQIHLGQEALDQANCSPEVFRCTVTKIPETASLLQKSRLPLGLLIHPFKDLSYLPVIQCNIIVRCRACRTYINPFVYFVDLKRWKCNLCFRVNELPEEFQYDPVSKTYGDPSRRPEIKSSTIEYIAPAEYMLRPPQPAVYLYLLDVSRLAVESGYLNVFCATLLEELKNIPGDARTQIGFLAYDSTLHFFSLAEGLNQPHELTVLDIDDGFLPTPDNLLVNLKDRMDLVEDLLNLLPKRFSNTFDCNSALGAALQVAHKMMGPTGGRVTVFQAALPNIGPGAVTCREDPNQRATAETPHLNPVNDFYKRLALECSGQQVAVDLFVVNSQYVDIATISGISRFSGGSIHHFPLFKSTKPLLVDEFQRSLRRYLTRKIGFEAVMRVRCTRGLAIHTFHGNFFVRSTDLLSLPNINPEAAFGMQVAIEENLADNQTVCFQAALLYTSSKGERRIRVHTLCIPIATTLHDVIQSADQQCIIGLLAKMAVDRSMQSSLSDAREAFINAAIDVLTAYKFSLNLGTPATGLLVPECLKLLPLYISAMLKHPAFRIGLATRLDDRVKAMIDLKTKPLYLLMQQVYPDMYPIHNLESQEIVLNGEEEPVPNPPRLQLSARFLENKGAFLLDCGDKMLILVGPNVPREFLNDALGITEYLAISEDMIEIPILDNLANQRLHQFINYLNDEKPYPVSVHIMRDNSPNRITFLERLIEDRLENSLSYHEFLQHLKTQIK